VGLQVLREKRQSNCGTTGNEREGTQQLWDYRKLERRDTTVVGLQVLREKGHSSCGTTGNEREGREQLCDYRY
jgi:hypothetical protein